MDPKLAKIIEEKYDLSVVDIVDAPRQFVAETYVLETIDHIKYFCKIVNKPLFIPHIISSLPVLQAIHSNGFTRINYPIPTKSNGLYIKANDMLIVLFNYIDAPQKTSYDMTAFGKLLGELHKTTKGIKIPANREGFTYKYEGIFGKKLESYTTYTGPDNILKDLQNLLNSHKAEIIHDYDNFISLGNSLKNTSIPMVITHGDPGGNTLVKTLTDLYLIDSDDLMLAPPERDLWFFQDNTKFLSGYNLIFPNYQVNQELSRFFIYKRYFEDLVEYFSEIDSDKTLEHRLKNFQGLDHDCINGWLRPTIRRFDPRSLVFIT